MTKRNRTIITVAIIAVSVLLLSWITNASTYLSSALVNNSQNIPSLSTNPASYSNWTGSIKLSNTLSQIIQSKVHTGLSDAVTSAEKSVGVNSHATSADLREERGYLVYKVWVVDSNNNSHKVIVDPGNGKILFTQQILNEFDDDDAGQHHLNVDHSDKDVYEYHGHDNGDD